MNGIQIGRIFGIEVAIHPSWFIILAFFAFSLATGFFPRAYGWSPAVDLDRRRRRHPAAVRLRARARVRALPGGPLAGHPGEEHHPLHPGWRRQHERSPTRPGREAWLAIAGPLVSLVIGAATLGAAFGAARPEATRRRALVPGRRQPLAGRLQPAARLPPGRRPRAARPALVDLARLGPGDRVGGPGRAGLRLGFHRPGRRPGSSVARLRRHLAHLHRLDAHPGGKRDSPADAGRRAPHRRAGRAPDDHPRELDLAVHHPRLGRQGPPRGAAPRAACRSPPRSPTRSTAASCARATCGVRRASGTTATGYATS